MSIEVETGAIGETMKGFAFAYMLTLGTSPRPHVVAVGVTAVDGSLRVSGVGRSSRRNIEGNDAVTLLWPPPDGGCAADCVELPVTPEERPLPATRRDVAK